jgi:hypothetical protein
MDLLGWGLYAAAAVVALAIVGYLYSRRETPGRGRRLLAALRWSALAVLLLLLFDPELPTTGLAAGGGGTRVLVDGSLSMLMPARVGESRTRWEAAVAEARRLAGRGDVLVFGAEPRVVAADSLAVATPAAGASRLFPALQAASEAGARRVVILTDGGVEDAPEVHRVLPRLGLEVDVVDVADEGVANRAIAEVEAPGWAEAGKAYGVEVGITAVGAAGDSTTVSVRQGDKVLASEQVALPAAGRVSTVKLSFEPTAPDGGGLVRYEVALEGDDSVADDDVRSFYVYVDEKPAGVALVSFRPDWEPRFLQPVLEQSLGLPVRGFLRVQPDRYIRSGVGEEAGRPATEAEVRRAIGQADLVVFHGLGADAPAWARETAKTAKRLLVFPAGDATELGLPVSLAPPTPGEWYASADIPASPVASLLASVPADELPPLSDLRALASGAGAWAPLEASRGRRGAGLPIAVAVEREGRRTVVATADGYWRWAFRGGEARQAYRRLWASLGGWLVEDQRSVAAGAIRPAERAAPRGEPLRWVAPGLGADSVAIRVAAEDGTTAVDTVVSRVRGDTLVTDPLAPGHYRFEARAFAGGEEVATAEGPLTVERYSAEFARPAVAVTGMAGGAAGEEAPRRLPGTPLHTTPWPYLLLVLLVSTEWTLRRRWGLR